MKQYKDELLSSCLTFVLSLHHSMVALDMRAYCPALEVGVVYLFHHVSSSVKAVGGRFIGSDLRRFPTVWYRTS